MLWRCAVLAVLLLGCGDDAPRDAQLDASTGFPDCPAPDNDDTPILSRPALSKASCAVATPPEQLSTWGANWEGLAMASWDETRYLAVSERRLGETVLKLSILMGDDEPLFTVSNGRTPGLAVADGALLMVWSDDLGAVHSVRLDREGAALASPLDVAPPDSTPVQRLQLVAIDSGYAVAWTRGPHYTDSGELQLVELDLDGRPAGPVRTLSSRAQRPHLAPVAGGFALAWMDLEAEGILLLEPGADEPYATGIQGKDVSIWPLQDEYLMAWVETFFNEDYENPVGYAVLKLALVDSECRSEVENLIMEIEVGDEHIQPHLFSFADHVGLSWSAGHVVYICAGCIPDHELRVVLLDPVKLAPVSNVVSVRGVSGGVLQHQLLISGSEITALFEDTMHGASLPALVGVDCQDGA